MNTGDNERRKATRSKAQQQGSAAMVEVMKAWEALTDEERLAWEVSGSRRRVSGITYFKHVNLRRVRRGDELLRLPPLSKSYNPKPLLKGLDIRNRSGRLTLELEFWRKPDGPRTVWASLPCNLGQKKPTSCPRLGWIPATQGRWCNITRLYLDKHGAQIKERGLQLVGKRIFVRLRLEVDEGVALFEQARAKVPKPEVEIDRKGPISSNKLRTSFERASNELRNITGTSRVHRASNARAGGRRGRKSRPGPLHPGSGPKRAGAG